MRALSSTMSQVWEPGQRDVPPAQVEMLAYPCPGAAVPSDHGVVAYDNGADSPTLLETRRPTSRCSRAPEGSGKNPSMAVPGSQEHQGSLARAGPTPISASLVVFVCLRGVF